MDTSMMGSPFKIPKKKQSSDHTSAEMLSPLLCLQNSSSYKAQWNQGSFSRKNSKDSSSLNGKALSSQGQKSDTKAEGESLVLTNSVRTDRGQSSGTNGNLDISKGSRTSAKHAPATADGLRVTEDQRRGRGSRDDKSLSPRTWLAQSSPKLNRTPSKNQQVHNSQAPSSETRFSNTQNRWRPKRASDTLCQAEAEEDSCAPPSMKSSQGQEENSDCMEMHGPCLMEKNKTRQHHCPERSSLKPGSIVQRTFGNGRNAEGRDEKLRDSEDDPSERSAEGDVPRKKQKSLAENPQAAPSGAVKNDSQASASAPKEKSKEGEALGTKALRSPSASDCRDIERMRSLRSRGLCSANKRPRPSSSEPIVLSSDDEMDEGRGSVSTPARPSTQQDPERSKAQKQLETDGQMDSEAAQVGQALTWIEGRQGDLEEESQDSRAGERRSDNAYMPPSIMELLFSELHVGQIKARANGTIVITDEGISIPLKDERSATEVPVTIVPSQLHWYGIWDGGLAKAGALLSACDEPLPSLLFLSVSESQAKLLQTELSQICTVNHPGQACPFLLLVLTERLEDSQAARLVSLMDLIGLCTGNSGLESPLSWAEGLNLIRRHGRSAHLLSLLGQEPSKTTSNLRPHAEARPNHSGLVPTEGSPARFSARGAQSKNAAGGFGTRSKPSRSGSAQSLCKQQSLPRRLIQFPPPPAKGGITVTTEDLECLNSGEFLNDVIIDFYLKYLLLEKADRKIAERSHVFSSFFYKQLTRKDNSEEASGAEAQYRRHLRVRTWTRHVDIFSKDYVFVPVNQEAHWYLVVICFPGLEQPQTVELRNPLSVEDTGVKRKLQPQAKCQGSADGSRSKVRHHALGSYSPPDCTLQGCQRQTVCRRPCILVMDSLKLSYHERMYKLLREYLQVEWEVRKSTPRHFTTDSIKGSLCRVPLQDNSSDCGLYLLQYVESFLQNPVVHFDLPIRLEHWFPRQQVRRKREEIRKLVLQLYTIQEGGAETSGR
ncbi:sentrin-specific protease 7b [Chanos chanos]|uniref:Sentrin-specific protease 7b n=1 Tax=Chanos chanos TaxID=29144 RepID=A0A6J2W5T1_CHACN|nr:sentrin-specific protease 7-like [Chanos chanos]